MNKALQLLAALLLIAGSYACKKEDPAPIPRPLNLALQTDKAAYRPGETVSFSSDRPVPTSAMIRYRHLDTVLEERPASGQTWNWQPPAQDFRGYLVEVYEMHDGAELQHGCIAVDVSTDWQRFPRYGFLSKFGNNENISAVIQNLNRHHINGLQLYDWHFRHHKPLAGTPANPANVWNDIINRQIYRSTVQGCIAEAKRHNMKAMFYNLAYGATSTAEADGVSPTWFLFKDRFRNVRDFHPLPKPPFISDIFVVNPGLSEWQQYLAARNAEVYAVFDFDGFHIDQLGDRGALYDYDGNEVSLRETFRPFTEHIKAAAPEKSLVFNAVNQYGAQRIAQSPVDFLYSEVWAPNETYADLAAIIRANDDLSNNTKRTVLAAYMNYDLANNPGFFNPPGVLLTDAVIFAFGGAHIELGEHMLGKEYFPNANLQMREDLKKALLHYYDFLVAYQNLLRDGGSFNTPNLSVTEGNMAVNNWPPQPNKVAIVGKSVSGRQVLHLINFSQTSALDWRDSNGLRSRPAPIKDVKLSFQTSQQVSKVWFASPDVRGGSPVQLAFQQSGNAVAFTLPYLEYWSIVVVE